MTNTTFLYAAYCVTWAIIIGYIVTLTVRSSKLRQEWDEFRRRKD
jgi:CcmD family protein